MKMRGESEGVHLGKREFVAGFGPDSFIAGQLDIQREMIKANNLVNAGAQAHFDTMSLVIVAGLMLEVAEDKTGAQFTVDASKKIKVEGGSDAGGVVVSGEKFVDGFDEIGGQKERIAGLQAVMDFGKELQGGIRAKIANAAAEKQDKEMFAA